MALTGNGYELSLGGIHDASGSTVYSNLHDVNVAENPTAVGSWDATITRDPSTNDYLMDDVYLYYDGELFFGGRLESAESSYESSTTKLSGRGVAVELKYGSDAITYTSTTVLDALRDYWGNHTDYTAVVLPPNRDIFDGRYTSEGELNELWSEFGFIDGSPAQEWGLVRESRLTTYQVNHTVDCSTSTTTVTGGTDTTDTTYSNETGVRIDATSGSVEWTADLDVNYTNSSPGLYVRLASSTTSGTIRFYVDGTETHNWNLSSQSISHQWLDVFNDANLSTVNGAPASVSGSTTVTVSVEGLASSEWVDVDAIGLVNEAAGTYTLPSSTNADGVYDGPEWYPDGVLIDADRSSNAYSNVTFLTSTDHVECYVETDSPVSSLTMKLKNITTGTTVTDTNSYAHPKAEHLFTFDYGTAGDEFAPAIIFDGVDISTKFVSGETKAPAGSRFELFAPDTSKYVTISDKEFTGTKFDILEELHELGKYRFAVSDYQYRDVVSFPIGTVKSEPNWTITSSTRTLDYTNYANKVTVHGKTASDGTYNSATVSDQDEIDFLGETIHKFEKNTDIETQSEVDTRAARLLDEKVSEKDESGQLTIVPQKIDVGYTYPVSNWSDAFEYGSRIGENALNFRDGQSDYVENDIDNVYDIKNHVYTFEFLIYPRNLKSLGDNGYRVLLAFAEDTYDYDFVRLYGDGSVGLDYGETIRTKPGIVNEDDTQRLSIRHGFRLNTTRFYIDGMEMDAVSNSITNTLYLDEVLWRLGAPTAGSAKPYDGGIDDVRFYNHFEGEEKTQQEIQDETYLDLVETPGVDIDDLVIYLRFDDRSTPSTAHNDGNPYSQSADPWTISGAQYDAAYGRLDEVQYSLGTDGQMDINFDISGRIDTEFAKLKKSVKRNTKSL